jgi:PPM family protein phosphatase
MMKIDSFGITDIGRKRQKNEDSFFVNKPLNLFIVADGMGGHAAGERASKCAVEAINLFIEHTQAGEEITWPFGFDANLSIIENRIKAAIHLAHRKILDASNEDYNLKGMATTIVVSMIENDKLFIGHVGDSRAYLMRENRIIQLTTDHSWVNEQLRSGIISAQQAKSHPFKNVVTRALGGPQDLEVDLLSELVIKNDILLMCSDGLTSMVDDKDLLDVIGKNIDNIETASRKLIETANGKGGNDNITLILAKILENEIQS